MAYFNTVLLFAAAIFSGLMVIAIIIAVRSRQESRNTIFPVVKETEGIKARRWGLAALIFLLLGAGTVGGWLAGQSTPQSPVQANTDTVASSTNNTTQAQTVAVTTDNETEQQLESSVKAITEVRPSPTTQPATPTPAEPKIVGSTTIVTAEPSATSQPSVAEPTATAAPVEQAQSQAPTAAAALPNQANIGPLIFATDITDNIEAVNPGNIFNDSTAQIYAILPYQGMVTGVPVSVVWYYQNNEIFRDDFNWDWGATGQSYLYIKTLGAGNYRLDISAGEDILATSSFELRSN